MVQSSEGAAPVHGRGPSGLGLHVSVAVALVILIALGSWQFFIRLPWKTQMLERIAAAQTAPAEPLSPVLNRIADKVDIDYVRVQFACPDLERLKTVRLYALDDDGPKTRLIAACPLPGGPYDVLLVDRGFARDPAPEGAPSLSGPVIGVLRSPERASFLTPAHTGPGALWYSRDVSGMARELGARHPAPVMLMLESPAPVSGNPRPAALPVNLPNNHLGYALTWFGLALALIGVYIALLRRKR